jgi:hypothetical protein
MALMVAVLAGTDILPGGSDWLAILVLLNSASFLSLHVQTGFS